MGRWAKPALPRLRYIHTQVAPRFAALASELEYFPDSVATLRGHQLVDMLGTTIRTIDQSASCGPSQFSAINKVSDILGIYDAYNREETEPYADEATITHDLSLTTEKLVGRLLDSDTGVRARAACILGLRRDPSEGALRLLLGIAHDNQGPVRCGAFFAIGEILQVATRDEGLKVEAIQTLSHAMLNDRSQLGRRAAGLALSKIGASSPTVVETFVASLESVERKDYKSRFVIVESLGNLGQNAKAALPVLDKVWCPSDDRLAKEYFELIKAEAVLRVKGELPGAGSKQLIMLRDTLRWEPNSNFRMKALEAIGRIPLENDIRSGLIVERLLLDETLDIRKLASEMLIRFDQEAACQGSAYEYWD
jgi:HEAT repeat protein